MVASLRAVCLSTLSLFTLLTLTGCPLPNRPAVKGSDLSLLVSVQEGDSLKEAALSAKARIVRVYELESLVVTLDGISLRPTEGGAPVEVLSEGVDLNLLDLLAAPDLLDSVSVPVGVYDLATLAMSNARAVFADDPGVTVPVDLIDGGVLQVPTSFESTADGQGLLLFDLGALTLVELDAGGYQLIPDLQVDLFTAVEAQVRGTIVSADPDTERIVVARRNARVAVDTGAADIFLPEDFQGATGTFADLRKGTYVLVIGTMGIDGAIDAASVSILEREDDDDDDDRPVKRIRYDLTPAGMDPDARGEAKYIENPGLRGLRIHLRDVTLVRAVLILVDDEVIADALVEDERAKVDLKTPKGDVVPVMTVFSRIEILDADTGETLLISERGQRDEGGRDDDEDDEDDDDD